MTQCPGFHGLAVGVYDTINGFNSIMEGYYNFSLGVYDTSKGGYDTIGGILRLTCELRDQYPVGPNLG